MKSWYSFAFSYLLMICYFYCLELFKSAFCNFFNFLLIIQVSYSRFCNLFTLVDRRHWMQSSLDSLLRYSKHHYQRLHSRIISSSVKISNILFREFLRSTSRCHLPVIDLLVLIKNECSGSKRIVPHIKLNFLAKFE